MKSGRQETALRLLALLLAVVFGSYMGAVTVLLIANVASPESEAAPGFQLGSPWPTVTSAGPAATSAGLRAGERLVSVQGRPFAGRQQWNETLEKLFPGDRIRVTVSDGGGLAREVSWQLEKANPAPRTPSEWVFQVVMAVGMPLLCLLVGFVTVFAKPREPQAWLLLGMLTTFSHSVVHPGTFPPSWGWFGVLCQIQHSLFGSSWPLFLFAFAWVFPKRMEWQEKFRWLFPGALILLLLGIAVSVTRTVIEYWTNPAEWGWLYDGLGNIRGLRLVQMAAICLFFVTLSRKVSALKEADARRRVQTILFGATLALTPLFLVIIAALVTGRPPASFGNFIILPALLAMGLFPLTLGYAIIVQRAFGMRVFIRQGLQYALARRGVRVLQAVLSITVLGIAVYLAQQQGMNRPRVLIALSAGIGIVFQLQRLAEWLGRWIDRRFFRESYDAEQLLSALSDDVRTMVETKPLMETVGQRISEALHVERIAMLVMNGAGFEPAYAVGYPALPGVKVAAASPVVTLLQEAKSPLRIYFEDKKSWIYTTGLSAEEQQWLRELDAEILLALSVKNKLLGFMSLGKKRSEEPYSGGDLRLLQSVAVQTGLALENSRLAEAVTEAVAQREVLHREVEIAQEVQERLFPQHLPAVPGLDYFGYCRPARGVGGDSYDFLVLDNGDFAVTIGDVSGKGIPAALLMASLQSALRGQAMLGPADLGQMMGTMNRLIFDSSPSNRYATLFYGQYDPRTRWMRYVNGGHNAPMILRGDEVVRLEAGGPVVGLFRPAKYSHGTVRIEPGDLFVGFTDGVSEAMNAADEEWGEEQLAAFLTTVGHLPAREMIPRILAAADAFAAGHPQHDDMTLVVIHFQAEPGPC